MKLIIINFIKSRLVKFFNINVNQIIDYSNF